MNNKIKEIVSKAQTIVILQADNPDADSLGSALALEQILGDMGKDVSLYCGIDIPSYLHYMSGWDRVQNELPKQFDLSIIVDASTYSLFGQLEESGQLGWVKAKPCIVLDHHELVGKAVDFAQVMLCNPKTSSTGEVIYNLCKEIGWKVSPAAGEFIMSSVLGDTQGLTNDLTKPDTYRLMAELVELGVDRPVLEEARREQSKMPETIYKYKARLLDRTEFAADGAVAHVTVPQTEINEFSPLYNPSALVQFDMLQVQGVRLCIVFKTYDDGKILAALRANNGSPIAGELAGHMGGGGHPYASGFKILGGRKIDEVKSETIRFATELLGKLDK